jgi:hypothetical protein
MIIDMVYAVVFFMISIIFPHGFPLPTAISLHQLLSRLEGLPSSLRLLFIPVEVSSEVSSSRVLAGARRASIRGGWKERERPIAGRGGSIGEAMIESWVEFDLKVVVESLANKDGAESLDP